MKMDLEPSNNETYRNGNRYGLNEIVLLKWLNWFHFVLNESNFISIEIVYTLDELGFILNSL